MSDRLQSIRARYDALPRKRWEFFNSCGMVAVGFPGNAGGRPNVVDWPGFDSSDQPLSKRRKYAEFIAHAPEDIAYLLTALTEARAQGAAEERERLAKCADAYGSTDLYDINDGGCQFLSRSEWCDTAHWLRSNTGEV